MMSSVSEFEGLMEAALNTEQICFGIAITTFNRRKLLMDLIAELKKLTQTPFELVVCDDGSQDDTVEVLRQSGITVIGGTNRGIAWNKNRGLYYLINVVRCDVVLLIDDDVMPICAGWERPWIEATCRYGHVNLGHPNHPETVLAGNGSAADPALATLIAGWAFSCSRQMLPQVGYLDLRFGRYGHEHSDFSFRAVRAGFGGIVVGNGQSSQTLFFVVDGGLRAVPTVSSGTQEELNTNARLLAELGKDQIYRHAWRNDAEMGAFLAEMAAVAPDVSVSQPSRVKNYSSIEAYFKEIQQNSGEPTKDGSCKHKKVFLIAVDQETGIEAALAGGETIIAVEPDAKLYYTLAERFADAITEGRLVLENFAPAPRGGEIAMLTPRDGGRPYPVATISWGELVAKHGRPARVHMAAEIPGFPTMTG
jgi:hypothetical protein